MSMVDDRESGHDELDACGIPCEIGTVRFEYDVARNQQRLVSATIDIYPVSQDQDPGPQQVCFEKLLDGTIDTLPHTFAAAELKTFVSEFRRVCLGG
jgi:hypothetical protein